MRRSDLARANAALAPVRAALLRRARADRDQILAEAKRRGDSEAASARARANARLAKVTDEAATDAEAAVTGLRLQAQHASRIAQLAAQRDAYEEFRRRVRSAVTAVRDTPDYPAIRDRLAARIRDALGDDATITEAPGGGLVGEAGGRRLDLSLSRICDRAVETAGPEVVELWTP